MNTALDFFNIVYITLVNFWRVFFYVPKIFSTFFQKSGTFLLSYVGVYMRRKNFLLADKWMTVRTEQTATTFFEESERILLKCELTAQRHRDM